MTNIYQRIASISLYVLFAIGVVIAILFYTGGNLPENAAEPKITDTALTLAYIYFGIAAILALVMPVFFRQQSKGKSMLFLALGFILVLVISYALGSGEPMKGAEDISTQSMKFIDGGLLAAYILLGIAFIGVIFAEISGFFR